jgi:hypothetical protein
LSACFFQIDLHVIRSPSCAAQRLDTEVAGYEHDRLDALLSIPPTGTGFVYTTDRKVPIWKRFMFFRPAFYLASKSAPEFIWGTATVHILSVR